MGRSVSVTFFVRNVSARPATLQLWVSSAGVVIHAADGTTYESSAPVAASTEAASKDSTQTVAFWGWNGTSFEQDGMGTCGGESYSWGGTGPSIEWISACPS